MIFNNFENKQNIVKAPNYADVLKTEGLASNQTRTWTATKDCWIVAFFDNPVGSTVPGSIYINDALIAKMPDDVEGFLPLYVKKGSVVKAHSYVKYTAYGCYA